MARHPKQVLVCTALLALGAVSPAARRQAPRSPQTPGAVQTAVQSGTPVRTVPAGERRTGNPGEKGATYYALESQTVRLTTRFADAVAVAERGLDGDVQTRLHDGSGNEVGRFKIDRIDAREDVLQYLPSGGAAVQAMGDPAVRPTLDWSNRQVYSLWRDRAEKTPATLEWQSGLMRPRGAARRDIDRDIVSLEMDWANGLSSKTVRRNVRRHQIFKDRAFDGEVLVSRLTKDDVEVGTVNWFVDSQTLVWNLPGLSKGYLGPEHLKEFGGWPFKPDMAWLNLQTTAFHHYKTLIQKQGYVARREPDWRRRVLQFFSPTLLANQPGCDGLHWLDGTILRFCCDVHDLCYEKFGCNYKSWFQFWTSWQCDFCNAWVVVCFADGGVDWSHHGMLK